MTIMRTDEYIERKVIPRVSEQIKQRKIIMQRVYKSCESVIAKINRGDFMINHIGNQISFTILNVFLMYNTIGPEYDPECYKSPEAQNLIWYFRDELLRATGYKFEIEVDQVNFIRGSFILNITFVERGMR
jgi:hypothetical protein